MSYRCGVCDKVVGPGASMTKVVVERVVRGVNGEPRKEIAREIPVCQDCRSSSLNGQRKKPTLRMNVPIDF